MVAWFWIFQKLAGLAITFRVMIGLRSLILRKHYYFSTILVSCLARKVLFCEGVDRKERFFVEYLCRFINRQGSNNHSSNRYSILLVRAFSRLQKACHNLMVVFDRRIFCPLPTVSLMPPIRLW
ncbi:hypothetical protein O6H91_03G066500 [Diphasiastrum complanatum]|uniref:Uncharacterized protein n=1 Tax=Diphasiastrum complanatum TaxID=34168 RepID=A0ACC2E7X9_DIPCM|nr:hypothetical protein O6H91_Y254300 [Diphasiastrum complanatum]KAJ7562367.1 hypothetical protein O6H91_03G066500 [Diphasiastrum complanatum]